jgi:AcrR family transcriptional regulator
MVPTCLARDRTVSIQTATAVVLSANAASGEAAGNHEDGRMAMRAPPPPTIRLAGEDLRDHRHVCALVDGPDEAYGVLLPFIAEGFEQGERALHIVDPLLRDEHLERLTAIGIDVPARTASHQLEVQTWADAYLRGGRFDRTAQLAYVRQRLGEGPGLGYPVTRIIGSMDWALDTEIVGDLLIYEARLDDLLRMRPDVVICTYDLSRHSARTIADVLGLHPVAIVGGVLRTSRGPARASARDRLLTAASQLFQETGIQATGVDALIKSAGVAKATFYRHFPSKDDLVIAWLTDPRTRWLEGVRDQAEADGATPAEVISRFFEAVTDWLEAGGYRGCPYLNTGVEITEPMHPARLVIREYLQEVEDYLEGLVAAAGYRDSRRLAAELQTLTAGAISLAVARRDRASMATARDAAMILLAKAERA